jgi:large subunit ribosomal protein L10
MRKEKQLLLDDIKERMDASKAVVFTRYHKLEPNKTSALRMNLAKSGASLAVVKKRLFLKAAQQAGVSLEPQLLEGHIAVIFSLDDPFATTKAIYSFCQENEQTMQVIGGRFDGVLCSAQDVKHISELPSKDEMRAQFLGTLEAPLSQTLAVMDALLTSVLYCLENKVQQNN